MPADAESSSVPGNPTIKPSVMVGASFTRVIVIVVALITVLSGVRYLSDNDRYHKASVCTPLSTGGEGRIADSG